MTLYKDTWLGNSSIKAEAPLQIVLYIVIAGGLFGALFLGRAVANNSFSSLALIFGASIAVGVCLFLKQNIWLLIPLCYTFAGKVAGGRVPLSISEIAIVAAFGMYVVLHAMKAAPPLPKAKLSDLLLYVNLIWIIVMFIRNPAGVLFIQSDIIGGRPYASIFIFVLGYWTLQHITLEKTKQALIPILMAISATATGFLGTITQLVPGLVPVIHPIYSGISTGTYLSEARSDFDAAGGTGRFTSLQDYAVIVTNAVCSFFRATDLLFLLRPFWSVIFYSTLIASLLSGFRSVTVYWLVVVLLSSYFRRGFGDVVRICFIVLVGLGVILVAQTSGFNVPIPMQRALSFIPAEWDAAATGSANDSSEWRFTMWKEALSGNRYIKNKLLGDGYGYDIKVLQAFMASSGVGALLSQEQIQEYFLITGGFHSGPISSIRYGGAVGLFLITALLISCATYGWKLIYQTRHSPFFGLALFAGIPAIYRPLEYWFVFGGFDSVYPHIIMTLALLNITSRSLSAWKQSRPNSNTLPVDISSREDYSSVELHK